MKLHKLLMAALAAGMVAGCGGGHDDTPADPPATPTGAVPPGATASILAWVGYTGMLAASETAAPLNVDAVVPPTSETDAPLAVD